MPPKVFDGLELNHLYLQSNDLSQLHAGTFHGLTFGYNSILNISHNQLQVLHADTFQNLTFLSFLENVNGILDMSQNKLQRLPPKVFDGLELHQLYPQNNSLSQLHPETFRGLTFQTYYTTGNMLDMSCNKLQDLPQDVFQGIEDLDILNMSQNKLQVLHAETFQFLSCGILDMSQNNLQDLPPKVFDSMSDLKILNLAENELSTLPDRVFYGGRVFNSFRDLRSLRLEGNRLRSLGTRPFYWLIRLEELNLERNLLTDLDEDVFECHVQKVSHWSYGYVWVDVYLSLKWNLLELKLGGNRLTALPDGLFNGFRKLRNLQLQSNQLVRLPQRLFQTLGEVHWAFTGFQPYLPLTLHLFPFDERELEHVTLS